MCQETSGGAQRTPCAENMDCVADLLELFQLNCSLKAVVSSVSSWKARKCFRENSFRRYSLATRGTRWFCAFYNFHKFSPKCVCAGCPIVSATRPDEGVAQVATLENVDVPAAMPVSREGRKAFLEHVFECVKINQRVFNVLYAAQLRY